MKLNSVQYLRAAAVLFVVAYHAGGNLGNLSSHYRILDYGRFGVDLFFVISGFIMVVTTTANSSSGTFIAKRLWRIVPLYWLVTLCYVAILFVDPAIIRSATFDTDHILKSFLFIPSYNPKFPSEIWPLVIPGWSLTYEMYFYGIFALALVIPAPWRYLVVTIILLILVGIGQVAHPKDPILITYTNSLLLEFVIGVIVGITFLNESTFLTRTVYLVFFIIAAASIACISIGIEIPRSIVCGSISGTVLSFLVSLERTGVKFSNVFLISVGDASYSIYLTHPALTGMIRRMGDAFHLIHANADITFGVLFITIIASVLLGFIVFTQVELRTMRWRKMYLNRRPNNLSVSI